MSSGTSKFTTTNSEVSHALSLETTSEFTAETASTDTQSSGPLSGLGGTSLDESLGEEGSSGFLNNLGGTETLQSLGPISSSIGIDVGIV